MTFRFGDGKAVKSSQYYTLPVYLCGKEIMLGTHVITGDLPMLFSKESMKNLGVSLDIENDKIVIGGIEQDLLVTKSGHYVADLLGLNEVNDSAKKVTMFTKESDPEKTAIKLHRYFGHPKSKSLLKLVENTDTCSPELKSSIIKLDSECEHCIRFKRDPSRPKVSIWSPNDVNEAVSMDLKQLSTGDIMLHIVDMFSRFSLTRIIEDKRADTVMLAFMEVWMNVLGRPKLILSDNGGEFVNRQLTEMCEAIGIEIRTTGATSPFSNGLCERHNGLIADCFDKLLNEMPNADPRIILAWATNAKNSLASTHGYSPYTLVFGRTPTIPGLDTVEMITTMNSSTVSKVLCDHLNAMYQSRVAFQKSNNESKIKRALKGRIPNVEEHYVTGDKVYFRKANQKRWCGPATVIGKDGKVIFLRQGGSMLRVHATKSLIFHRPEFVDHTFERSR